MSTISEKEKLDLRVTVLEKLLLCLCNNLDEGKKTQLVRVIHGHIQKLLKEASKDEHEHVLMESVVDQLQEFQRRVRQTL